MLGKQKRYWFYDLTYGRKKNAENQKRPCFDISHLLLHFSVPISTSMKRPAAPG